MLLRTALIVLTGVLFWLPSAAGQPLADRPEEAPGSALTNLKVGANASYVRALDARALHQAIASGTGIPAASMGSLTRRAHSQRAARVLAPDDRRLTGGVDVLAADDVPERQSGWDQEWLGRLALLLEVHGVYQRAVEWQTSEYQLRLDPMSLGWTLKVPLRKEDSSDY